MTHQTKGKWLLTGQVFDAPVSQFWTDIAQNHYPGATGHNLSCYIKSVCQEGTRNVIKLTTDEEFLLEIPVFTWNARFDEYGKTTYLCAIGHQKDIDISLDPKRSILVMKSDTLFSKLITIGGEMCAISKQGGKSIEPISGALGVELITSFFDDTKIIPVKEAVTPTPFQLQQILMQHNDQEDLVGVQR